MLHCERSSLKVRNLEERGRDWAHIYDAYLSLVAIVCI
jgi:hypothetical protein